MHESGWCGEDGARLDAVRFGSAALLVLLRAAPVKVTVICAAAATGTSSNIDSSMRGSIGADCRLTATLSETLLMGIETKSRLITELRLCIAHPASSCFRYRSFTVIAGTDAAGTGRSLCWSDSSRVGSARAGTARAVSARAGGAARLTVGDATFSCDFIGSVDVVE